MRKFFTLLAVTVFCSGVALAAEVVTITGEGKCAKCALKETKTCQNAVIVEKDGMKKTYYLAQNDVAKKAHAKDGFCRASKEEPIKVKVTGTCVEKDGKHLLTPTEKITKVED